MTRCPREEDLVCGRELLLGKTMRDEEDAAEEVVMEENAMAIGTDRLLGGRRR